MYALYLGEIYEVDIGPHDEVLRKVKSSQCLTYPSQTMDGQIIHPNILYDDIEMVMTQYQLLVKGKIDFHQKQVKLYSKRLKHSSEIATRVSSDIFIS